MKYFVCLLFIVLIQPHTNGQFSKTDSLKQLLEKTPKDTNRVNLLMDISNGYYFFKPDTSLLYSKMALELSRELDFTNGIITSLNLAGESSRLLGDYPGSLKMQMEALELTKETKNPLSESISLGFIGITYNEMKEYRIGLQYLLLANLIFQKLPVTPNSVFILANIGITYTILNKPDSALYYLRLANEQLNYITHPQLKSFIPISIGNVYAGTGNKDSALYYYYLALQHSRSSNESINMSRVQQKIAELYYSDHQYDSSRFYARNAFKDGNRTSQKINILESSTLLVKLYRQANMLDSAFYYEDIASATKESLYGPERFKQLQLLMLEEQQQQQRSEQEQEQFRNRIKYTILIIALCVFLLVSFILLQTNRQKQKANTKIEKAYSELKSTQSQLIQSEKMASLGELTAGIAHEIQNPLNFINNFSDVNRELVDEMQQELKSGKIDDAIAISNDIKENEEKINHHGKRADAIVKGMLQHSRTSSGQKEPTDINALADEYLRFSYHGLRAKEKSFNATVKTDFDESIGNINIVPQDIGRVILNLINNAFYAVSEKQKQNPNGYEPTVVVSTKKEKDKIEIKVRDNGNGIPQNVLDKIFQPFFTTKPTGQGTGLGLSLSYDIVKAHSGEIKAETKEGEGTVFSIILGT
jgi:two-component system, NtrC family, sensor kinase